MRTLTITAKLWKYGWELEIDEDHHTQCRTLAQARQQVIDYLDTDRGGDYSDWDITIITEAEKDELNK